MRIDIRTRGLEVPDELRALARRRIHFALGRFGVSVQRVTVRLVDLNGPRGGIDKRCRLSVKTRARGTFVVEDTDEHIAAAVGRAAARMNRTLARALDGSPDGRHAARRHAARP